MSIKPGTLHSITRNLIRGHDGVITYTPHAITVALDRPASPRLANALRALLDHINTDPPRMPGRVGLPVIVSGLRRAVLGRG